MVECLIWTIKEQYVHRYYFESLQHANRVLNDWIQFYNEVRPHQALGMKTPVEAYALSLWLVQKVLGHYSTYLKGGITHSACGNLAPVSYENAWN